MNDARDECFIENMSYIFFFGGVRGGATFSVGWNFF
jgi:hypothetical protein